MKVLVYGCGVIGSYLVHVLCRAGNDVTVVSRGRWRKVLSERGLCIRHRLQLKTTVDHPRVAADPDPAVAYDAVFSIMQGQQQAALLPELARANAPMVVLVGNNPDAGEVERAFHAQAVPPKSLLFAFQATAGVREESRVICVRAGAGSLTVGGLHAEPTEKDKARLREIFAGSKYEPHFMDDMEGWLYCHAATVLPIVYVCYACGCDLRRATPRTRADLLRATAEAFGLLSSLGIPIRPRGEESFLQPGIKRALVRAAYFVIAKTSLGDLIASDHCRNAVPEMEWLDQRFEALRAQNPSFPMPVWDSLRAEVPAWHKLRQIYSKKD